MDDPVLILYFTGSGNSRIVSRALASRLPRATIQPLLDKTNRATQLERAAIVGIVFPVHFMQAPRAVLNELGSMVLKEKNVFLIATSGGEAGDALGQVSDVLKRRGALLAASAHIPIADNSVVAMTSPTDRARNMALLGKRLDDLKKRLTKGEPLMHRRHPYRWRVIGYFTRFGMRSIYHYERKKIDIEKCAGCGLCVGTCPLGNIGLIDGKAVIGNNCSDCFGCLHACPVSAISFGRIRVSPENRYRSPSLP